MAKLLGYERGAVNYFFGSITGNPIAMYIYGGGIMAYVDAIEHTVDEGVLMGVLYYFLAKRLPPTSIQQVITQIVVGSFVAMVLWYAFVPKQGRRW